MGRGLHKRLNTRARLCLALVICTVCISLYSDGHKALGDVLHYRSLTLTNAQASSTATYKFQFDITTAGMLGSIQAEFCSNSPILSVPCVAPSGFDILGSSLAAQAGETGFSISPLTTANKLILNRVPSNDVAGTVSYVLDNVLNPSSEGSYYARLQTFATSDASGPNTDYGGLAYDINSNLLINAEVPPYLTFCGGVIVPAYNCSATQGNLVNLGILKANKTSSGQSQILVSTNAQNGYAIYAQGTTLTSGNNVIPALTSPSAVFSGSNQFGLNLRSNLSPAIGQDPSGPGNGLPTSDYNQPNRYKFVSGDLIATAPTYEEPRRYTISYIADASDSQTAGVYVSTVTYVCIGDF